VPLTRAKSDIDVLEHVSEGVHVDTSPVHNHASDDDRGHKPYKWSDPRRPLARRDEQSE
jgi:hypothetical protein